MNEIEEEFVKSLKALLIRYGVELVLEQDRKNVVWALTNNEESLDDNIYLTLATLHYEINK